MPSLETLATAFVLLGGASQLALVILVRGADKKVLILAPILLALTLSIAAACPGGGAGLALMAGEFGLAGATIFAAASAPAPMDEGVVFGITAVFWLCFWRQAVALPWWIWPAAAATVLSVVGVALAARPWPVARLSLYLWAMAALFVLSVARFPDTGVFDAGPTAAAAWAGREWLLALGGFWVGAYLTMLFYYGSIAFTILLALPDLANGWDKVTADGGGAVDVMLMRKFSAGPVPRTRALCIAAAQAAVVIAAHSWAPISRNLAVQATLSLVLLAPIFERPVRN